MKSTIALVIAIVSLTLTSGNIIYSFSARKASSELEAAALAFFKEEEARRTHNKKVQQQVKQTETALDVPIP